MLSGRFLKAHPTYLHQTGRARQLTDQAAARAAISGSGCNRHGSPEPSLRQGQTIVET